MAGLRLDKLLSHSGFGTRTQIKTLLAQKKVQVNGAVTQEAGLHIDIQNDVIKIEGAILQIKQHIYLMLNKGAGVVCEAKSNRYKTVFDTLPLEYKHSFLGGNLHIIGRLDQDTTGLLLLTTDGSLTHRLISPKNHISKTYKAELCLPVAPQEQKTMIQDFEKGFFVSRQGKEKEFFTLPAQLQFQDDTHCTLVIYEGKFHQAKRMFLQFGNKVTSLKRIAIGDLKLDVTLKTGEIKELSKQELQLLEGNL